MTIEIWMPPSSLSLARSLGVSIQVPTRNRVILRTAGQIAPIKRPDLPSLLRAEDGSYPLPSTNGPQPPAFMLSSSQLNRFQAKEWILLISTGPDSSDPASFLRHSTQSFWAYWRSPILAIENCNDRRMSLMRNHADGLVIRHSRSSCCIHAIDFDCCRDVPI